MTQEQQDAPKTNEAGEHSCLKYIRDYNAGMKVLLANIRQSAYNDGLKRAVECLPKEIDWKYKSDGCCIICDYIENSGETHGCETYNDTLATVRNNILKEIK